jgi:5-formyltetrahydrofolate cyclo-ligase
MPTQNKSQLRTELLKQRRALKPHERSQAAEQLLQRLQNSNLISTDSIVAAYWPMIDELDMRPIINWLHEKNIVCALPCLVSVDQPLLFRRFSKDDLLAKAYHNISQPHEHAPLVTPDIILVPTVGFDRRGYRIGMGGGFYDRTLANSTGKIVGVAYSSSEIENVPAEVHDIRMHAILSEKELIEIAP